MKKPILLIAGVMTSGKTTLAQTLVGNFIYDFMIEIDMIKQWSNGTRLNFDQLWTRDKDRAHEMMHLGNIDAGLIAAKFPKNVVMSGVWPGEVQPILQSVQDWRLLVLKTPTKEEAWARWLERKLKNEVSGDQNYVDAIKRNFDNSPWGVQSWWDDMRVTMSNFAIMARKKKKLVTLSDILSDKDLASEAFSKFRDESIGEKS